MDGGIVLRRHMTDGLQFGVLWLGGGCWSWLVCDLIVCSCSWWLGCIDACCGCVRSGCGGWLFWWRVASLSEQVHCLVCRVVVGLGVVLLWWVARRSSEGRLGVVEWGCCEWCVASVRANQSLTAMHTLLKVDRNAAQRN